MRLKVIAAAAALAAMLPASAAPGAYKDWNVTVTVGWENCYRPVEWTPVELNLQNPKLESSFGGVVALTGQQDGLNKLTVAADFVLTKDYAVDLPLVIKLAYGAPEVDVSIRSTRGRLAWSRSYDLASSSQVSRLRAIGTNDLLIGVSGRFSPTLTRLGQNSISKNDHETGAVFVKRKLLDRLPHDWTGYASLDAMVLFDPEWHKLRPAQSQALVQWVSNGGRLLIVLGARPLPPEHPIAALLPFKPDGPQQIAIPASTCRLWDAPSRPGKSWEARTISSWSLAGSSGAGWETRYAGDNAVWASGPVSFGRVAVMGFDPTQLLKLPPTDGSAPRNARSRTNLAKLWCGFLSPMLGRRQIEFHSGGRGSEQNYYDSYFEVGPVGRASNAVIGHLQSIPEMRPLSIWWVIGLLTALAVLLGPIDYLLLKRLGRLPLTWITSAVWVALFSVGAYYGVQALRAGAMQVRVVSVLDAVEGADCAWCTRYSGIFAPASDDYGLTGTGDDEWWSGIAPTRGGYMSMGGEGLGSRQIWCSQVGGGNLPESVPINIWSMQYLMTEAPVKEMPFSATVERLRGNNEVVVRIVNHSASAILRGQVRLQGGRVLSFSYVAGESEGEFRGHTGHSRSWDEAVPDEHQYYYGPEDYYGRFSPGTAYSARGSRHRTEAIEEYLRRGAAAVCVEYDRADVAVGVAKRKCEYNHIQLARMVVFPKSR